MRILAAAVVAGCVHAALWYGGHERILPPDAPTAIESLSFSPFAANQDAEKPTFIPREQIESDIKAVAPYTRMVRTYSVDAGQDAVAEIAGKHGVTVMQGIWIGHDEERNERELDIGLQIARQQSNVRALIVGNEVILRNEKTPEEMIQILRDVRQKTRVPVTYAEVWNLWLDHPKLANEVDFISAHVLPYWEGIPAEQAIQYALDRYADLKRAFPGKKIVIAEFGWPSAGTNVKAARPGALEQAELTRRFMVEADKRGIDYNIVEAFDQPWKTGEGAVGPYWGVFDANRQPKFALEGMVEKPHRLPVAAIAITIGVLATVIGLRRRKPTLAHAMVYAGAANLVGAGIAMAAAWPFIYYWSAGTLISWAFGLALVVPLMLITLGKVHEIAAVVFGRKPGRLITEVVAQAPAGYAPKVSIHIPAYKERPEMLMATLDSVAALDYPNYECLVIVNNTPEPEYWEPIKAHCERLGERFKFLHLLNVKGFKAGAMNLALQSMADDAEVIAVIDADYVVDRAWLKDLVPAFHDPKVALVQAPQDHRDGRESLFKTMMNAEYAGFFDIGMVQRNEDNAIIAHGTMLMVRRSAFDEVGQWGTDTIVEDTELGLRLFEAGYSAHYTARRYGWGLLPDTFKAFKTQRNRWAYGAVQIIKKHWPHMLPGRRTLSANQKSAFVTGWSYWLSDALGVAAALMNLVWVPFLLFVGVAMPETTLTIPILMAFVVNIAHCAILYRARVKASWGEIAGAAFAAMSLQWTVAAAVLTGFVKDNLAFKVTDKGGKAKKATGAKADDAAKWEGRVGMALLVSAVVLTVTNTKEVTELYLFAAILATQSVPFLSAVMMRGAEWLASRKPAPVVSAQPVGEAVS